MTIFSHACERVKMCGPIKIMNQTKINKASGQQLWDHVVKMVRTSKSFFHPSDPTIYIKFEKIII